ncbi:WD40 repeat-like protein, partial [Ceratobasidium sp. UAMH 11750]
GPAQSVSALISPSNGTFLAGSGDGRVTSFTTADGAQPISGDPHGSQVVSLATTGGKVYSAGFDDTVREIDVETKKFSASSIGTNGQPKGVAVSGSTVFVASLNGVLVSEGGKERYKLPSNSPATAIDVHGKTLAVGSEVRYYH